MNRTTPAAKKDEILTQPHWNEVAVRTQSDVEVTFDTALLKELDGRFQKGIFLNILRSFSILAGAGEVKKKFHQIARF